MRQPPSDTVVGQGRQRVDARAKVTGRAPYAAEVAVANVAHAVIVGSTAALGRIASIDVAEASRSAGVLRVLTHENAPRLPLVHSGSGPPLARTLQLLQDDQVRYADQPVALVIADSLENARGAAELVSVRYETRTPLVDLEANASSAYAPPQLVRGPTDSDRGDFERAFAGAPVRVDATYRTPVQNHNPMEMHATIAVWQGSNRVTIYDSTQGIFNVRKTIAAAFGIPPERVRVISLYVGGGFGCKGRPWSHVTLAAMAASALGRPVKLMVTRPQMFALVGHRPPTVQRVSLGADRGGKLLAVRHDLLSETSRFDDFAEPSATVSRMLYASPNARTSHRIVRLDVPTPTFMRAPGESTGSFAIETAMDELSYALGLDPLALRVRNHAERDPESGKPWSSKSLLTCYHEAADGSGGRAATGASALGARGTASSDGGWRRPPIRPDSSPASGDRPGPRRRDRLGPIGHRRTSAPGPTPSWRRSPPTRWACRCERVTFELGDTNLPEAPGSGGSRRRRASAPRSRRRWRAEKLIALAVADRAVAAHGLPRRGRRGRRRGSCHAGRSGRRETIRVDPAARRKAGRERRAAPAEEHAERKNYALHSFGAAVRRGARRRRPRRGARPAHGGRLRRAAAILNAKTARSQLLGGIVWGIGMALHEETVRDPPHRPRRQRRSRRLPRAGERRRAGHRRHR